MLRSILATYREAFSGLDRSVWLLSLATLVNRSGTMVMPFLVLYLTEQRGFAITDAGRALGVYGVGGVLGSYLGGWLCDRMPPRRVMAGSLALAGMAFILLGRFQSRPAILLTIFGLAVVGEGFRPATSAALAGAAPPELRTRAFALNRLAINLGMSLGPSIGGFLAMRSYDWLFVVDGGTSLLAAAVLAAAFHGGGQGAEEKPPAVAVGRSPWRDGPFLVMMALFFLLAMVTFQMASTFTLTLRDVYGFHEGRIGLVMTINTVIIVLFEMVLVHRLGAREPLRIVGVGGFLFGLGFALLPFGAGFAYVAFTVLIWTVGEMLSFPLAAGAVANRAGEANRGLYMGLFTLSFEGAWIFAPILGTWVYQAWGPRAVGLACGVLGLVLFVGFQAVAAWTARERGR
jgi:predicted MFS family arabinose efflux permease